MSLDEKKELERYQKYLKSIKKYDPLDDEEYLYLTQEMSNLINNTEKLSDIEVLELTRKLEKIENTKDYTVELLELTREIKQIISPSKGKIDIPKVDKKVNPKKEMVKPLSSTSVLPKIKRKEVLKQEDKKEIKEVKKENRKPNGLTLKDLVDKNNSNNKETDYFKTEQIQKIRTINAERIKKQKKKHKNSKIIWTIIFFISLIIFLLLIIRFVMWKFENNSVKNQMDDIYALADVTEVVSRGAVTDVDDIPVIIETPPEEEVVSRPSDYWYYMSMSMLDVNFKELKAINNHTAGWIRVNGTNINYPYVHYTDNEYYLKHSFNGNYNSAGWVFLDYRNDPDNFGRNNILYAHGRLDNTMFGSMKKLVTPAWYNNSNNYVVKTSNEGYNALWQVFSVYTILPESYYIRTKFNDSEFETFINTITSRSVHDFGVMPTIEDKILTLSSCYDDTRRVVLHAKLIKIEEK